MEDNTSDIDIESIPAAVEINDDTSTVSMTTTNNQPTDNALQPLKSIEGEDYRNACVASENCALLTAIADRRNGSHNYRTIKKELLKVAPKKMSLSEIGHSQALFFITARAMIYSCSTSPNIRFLREFFMDDYGLDTIEAKHTPTTKYLALLVHLGADLTQRRPGGDTLLHLLFRKCADIDVVLNHRKNFCQAHYKWTDRGEKCIINFNKEILDISLYLLEKGLSLHDHNNRGETPLSLLLETMQSSMATFQAKDGRWKNRHVVHLYTDHLRRILQASTELPLNINGIPLLEYTHSIDPVLGKCLLKEIMRRKSPQLLPSEQFNIVGIDVEPRCDELVTIKL